jgi:hypothetical protein
VLWPTSLDERVVKEVPERIEKVAVGHNLQSQYSVVSHTLHNQGEPTFCLFRFLLVGAQLVLCFNSTPAKMKEEAILALFFRVKEFGQQIRLEKI